MLLRTLGRLEAHHRILTSVVVALAMFLLPAKELPAESRWVLAWDCFALTDILLSWIMFRREDPAEVRRRASLQDSSRTVLFTLVVAASFISLASVTVLLGAARSTGQADRILAVALTGFTIVLSWLLVHTAYAMRYAHLYYGIRTREGSDAADTLLFPGTTDPDYSDFAYFSFVIGMTCQVSDVQVAGRKLRKLVMLHGLLAFAFNTVVLALTISVISGILL